MGRIWMPGGGGGADLDAVTATAADVLAPKVIVGPDGEPLIGTMPDRGDWTGSVGMNGSVTIPDGSHVGSKVDGPVVTQRGAPVYSLPINGTQNISEGYYAGGKVTQNIPTQGSNFLTPTTYNQVVCAAGRYASGDQGVYGDPNLVAENIALNKSIFGVKGTHSAIEENPAYLYNRGTFASGLSMSSSNSNAAYEASGILCMNSNLRFNTAIDLTKYKYIKLVYTSHTSSVTNVGIEVKNDALFNSPTIANAENTSVVRNPNEFTVVLNIEMVNGPKWLFVKGGLGRDDSERISSHSSRIFQITLSV